MGGRDQAGDLNAALRALPSVEQLASSLGGDGDAGPLAVTAARATIAERREQLQAGARDDADLVHRAREALEAACRASLRRVINATGVVVHTNLGHAPLPAAARDAAARAGEGYSNLELDLDTGRRGSRQAHVEALVRELTGAPAALVVNNCAAATLLCAAALAGPGHSIVVSRGQLVEIGGSFRIPDVVAQSGSALVEVGTTNRTRLADYAAAVSDDTGAILRVHQSNFVTTGFVEDVPIEDLVKLGVPVIDDVGSGVLGLELGIPALAGEPDVRRSLRAGAALVCCSADKLLGGPQAGIVAGTEEAVGRARGHPLARAMRIDKLSLAALEATLALLRDPAVARREIPVLAMLAATAEELLARAERLHELLDRAGVPADVVEATARAGGGALPTLELTGPVVAVDPGSNGADALATALRKAEPPVVGRIAGGRLLLDPRTMADAEVSPAAAAVAAALAG
jgi:L-seryl-tRNA(Ser) seleniumtransferase